jgi:arylsulfatase A-like enzyme
MKQTPPNIVLIHSDQHRYDCMGAAGLRPDIQTAHLDALASGGTRFDHAFSTIPICTPARASLMTGAWPTTHGSFCIPSSEINRAARRELPLLTNLLADAGYRVAWTGKYHNELEEVPGPRHGVEEFVNAWQYHAWRERQGIPEIQREHGLFGDPDTACPAEKSPLAWQAGNVIRQIRERAPSAGSGQAPFFIRWDPPEPHLPCNPCGSFAERFAGAPIPPWTSFPDPLEGKPATQRRQLRIWGVEGWTWEQWLPTVRLYYAVIAEMDHHIGRVLAKLDELGLADNTLVIYSTDHGDYCGGHGQIDKHFNMYDDVTRVPLILRWPGTIPAGACCRAFASNSVDIAATLLDAAGIEKPDTFAGHSLLRMAADPAYQPRDYAWCQYFGTESGAYSMRMVRDRRYKFVYHPVGDMHEFYDLQTDPGELHNRIVRQSPEGEGRIDEPALNPEFKRLKAALFETMRAHGDRLANQWTATELCQ